MHFVSVFAQWALNLGLTNLSSLPLCVMYIRFIYLGFNNSEEKVFISSQCLARVTGCAWVGDVHKLKGLCKTQYYKHETIGAVIKRSL